MTTLNSIVDDALRAAVELNRPAAELSLAEIATAAGISRSTLIRRVGNRGVLDAALRARGGPAAGRRDTAADRAIAAAARLYAARGVGQVSLDDVAAEADCTVQAIYGQIGGRDALLLAVAEQHSPLPEIERALAEPVRDLGAGVLDIYRRIMGAVFAEPPVVVAVLAEMLSRPDGPVADYLRTSYAPRSAAALAAWVAPLVDTGQIRDLPPDVLLSLFAGPLVVYNLAHLLTHRPLTAAELDATATRLAAAFVRAVAPESVASEGVSNEQP